MDNQKRTYKKTKKTDYDVSSQSIDIIKEEVKILGYNVILTYPEYKFLLKSYKTDSNDRIICNTFSDIDSANLYIKSLNDIGLLAELEPII